MPYRYRWALLLGASCYFYMAFVPVYILILGFTIVIDYIAGIYIERAVGKQRKLFLILSLVANISVLVLFKYYNFINENLNWLIGELGHESPAPYLNILLPIGLSFHTFQAMSYTIEIYRGKQAAEKHFGIYSLYVMFYPQLVAGPIERPQNVLPQLHKNHQFSYSNMTIGLRLMLWGFFKKLVIADRLALYVDAVYDNPEIHNGSSVVIASIFFAFQIYCDFSSYSDIAIGAARTMGFNLMTNFRRPYLSVSITEFWNRWHISLSSWFRDYLFIPLGGNRVKVSRRFLNIFIVFMVSGLWHGASYNFVIWGVLHGLYQIIAVLSRPYFQIFETNLGIKNSKVWIILQGLFTFSLVVFAWVFFRATTFDDALQMITSLTSLGAVPFFGGTNQFAHCLLGISLLLTIEFVTELKPDFKMLYSTSRPIRWGSALTLLFLILFFGVFNGGQFIYFQF